MIDAPSPSPSAVALMIALVREGGIRIDTCDAHGVPALRTLLQADGNVLLFVREDCLASDRTIDLHFDEIERRVGSLLAIARTVEGRFALMSRAIRVLYGASGIASVGSTIASIVAGEVHVVWLAISLLPWALGWCLRRAPTAWVARRATRRMTSST